MFSEKVSLLLKTLHATNTDIARYAGCDASSISRLHTGARTPKPISPTVAKFIQGTYLFASNRNLLPLLCSLWYGLPSESEKAIKKAMERWLYENSRYEPILSNVSTKHTYAVYRSFGEKLNAVMNLLNLTNVRLGKAVNLDASYICRFRKGIRIPKSNKVVTDLLCRVLFEWTKEQHKIDELAGLMKLSKAYISDTDRFFQLFSTWLCDFETRTNEEVLNSLLGKIDSVSLNKMPLPKFDTIIENSISDNEETFYYGIEGFKNCILRFLGSAVKLEARELFLYSDMNMDWLIKDKEFRLKWFSLVQECVNKSIRIKIIHQFDWDWNEVLRTIENWFPLYMSGMITPYCCNKTIKGPFSHTLFLCPGVSSIEACHIKGSEEEGLYTYHINKKTLAFFQKQYLSLLRMCEPLFRIYSEKEQNNLRLTLMDSKAKEMISLLPALSFATLPKDTLLKILDHNEVPEQEAEQIQSSWQIHHDSLIKELNNSCVYEFAALADEKSLASDKITLELRNSLSKDKISYTSLDYYTHLQNILMLMERYPNYHFYAIPEVPFHNMYLFMNSTYVIILKTTSPDLAFVISNSYIRAAFYEFINHLKEKYKYDCDTTRQKLLQLIQTKETDEPVYI